MPTQTPVHRICILVPTFKRNDALLRLLNQARNFIDTYHGHNLYSLAVTDSDRNNPIAPLPPHLQAEYTLNPGTGFDDNLFFFWQNNVDRFDFIFALGDDDLFTPWLNPLYLLDAAIDTGNQVAVFNHRYYTLHPGGEIEFGDVNYPELDLLCSRSALLRRMFTTLPNYVGILYSTRLLKLTLSKAALFRNTLHLYAVPVLFAAAANSLHFSDYVLCLYHNDRKSDGAWTVSEGVMNGLVDFLRALRQTVPPDLYTLAETGFFKNYFSSNCWLRNRLEHSPSLKSEQQIRDLLAAS